MHAIIEQNRAEILALAKRHGVADVRVVGSMATPTTPAMSTYWCHCRLAKQALHPARC